MKKLPAISLLSTQLKEGKATQTKLPDGSMVLVDASGERVLALNRVAVEILELWREGWDETQLAEKLAEEYGISKEVLVDDILSFEKELKAAFAFAAATNNAIDAQTGKQR